MWQRRVRVRPMYGLKHEGMQSGSIGRQDRRKEAARKARSNFGVHPESHRLGLGNIVLHFSTTETNNSRASPLVVIITLGQLRIHPHHWRGAPHSPPTS